MRNWLRLRREPQPEPTSMAAVLKAAVIGDADSLERLAVARGRQRAERQARDAERERRTAAARVVLDDIRQFGWHCPSVDYSWRDRG